MNLKLTRNVQLRGVHLDGFISEFNLLDGRSKELIVSTIVHAIAEKVAEHYAPVIIKAVEQVLVQGEAAKAELAKAELAKAELAKAALAKAALANAGLSDKPTSPPPVEGTYWTDGLVIRYKFHAGQVRDPNTYQPLPDTPAEIEARGYRRVDPPPMPS